VLLLPDKSAALHAVLKGVVNDVDLLGATLDSFEPAHRVHDRLGD
jgi:hypothetical protein